MKLAKNDKLVMIGDSITDCGRNRPIGEGIGDPYGKGYVAMVDALLKTVYTELAVRVVNMGIGGNTVRDLAGRWQTDVLDLKPDWLSVMIGTNDVWRQYDQPYIPESHVYPEEYESTLDELVAKTKMHVKGVVLMTPFYLEPNKADLMRATMDRYGEIVRQVAERHGALFVDTQAAFDKVLAHLYPATLAWDRVHPSMAGHATLARAFLNAIDFVW
ncbi:SGNH/GDSL hydrolase family protein [Cohnella zeiphila]|uniref:SGNH/GDSL hydrolase family protein n=1 Tax=Cohnella zeiphila TaxID=2761120 RepID=A0A7X0SHU8_9BACL|nr:SGNH/GDSL hydrolase family protein [Cohnella zeiphila]MBB6730265.1 SGNH/GDSL hydrolase family protein [Cohnella zeiphila]